MKLQKLLLSSLTLLLLVAPTLQAASAANLSGAQLACPQGVVGGNAVEFFKAGVKFDPESHKWVDRYNGKMIDLGLPGVNERFAGSNVISAVAPPPSSANATTNATTTTSTFPWKKVITITVIGVGIATAIAVPIACGVNASHHRHHMQNNKQANQEAIYYYFHNRAVGPQQMFFAPPAPIFHTGKPAPPPKFL